MSPAKKRLKNGSPSDKEVVQTRSAQKKIQDFTTQSTRANDNTEDWRTTHWSTRNYHAATNDLFCDVSFVVGPEGGEKKTFRAHRLILTLTSPVFEAMFYGPLAETGPSIAITDITPDGFEALLQYIYTGEFDSKCSLDKIIQLWVAADKYCVPQVKDDLAMCFERIKLSPENVWSTLEQAIFLGIERLIENAKFYLMMNTSEALLAEGLLSVNIETMTTFLSMQQIPCEENYLLEALVEWGKAQKGTSLKKAIEPGLKLIRFGQLSNEDFCNFLDSAKGVINDSDTVAIFKHNSMRLNNPLPKWCCKEPRYRACRKVAYTGYYSSDCSSD